MFLLSPQRKQSMDINGCGAHFAGARDRVTTECTQDFPRRGGGRDEAVGID